MDDVSGKVVVITGASRGLGHALAKVFADRGARVAFCARGAASVRELADELTRDGASVFADACDVRDEAQIERFVTNVVDRFGRVDALVNNASILGSRVPFADYSAAQWRDVLDVNLTGTFLTTRAVLPMMKRQRAGSIVNLSSGVGNRGRPNWGAYLVSKWGIEGFTYALAEEVRGDGIRVNVVDPGAMRTEMRAAAYPQEDPMTLRTPRETAAVYLYLASDASADVTGQRFKAQEFSPRRT